MLNQTTLTDIELYIAMLSSDLEQLCASVPKEVVYWCRNVRTSLERIRDSIPELESQGKLSKLVVKQYTTIPVCHGFAMVKPFSISYFSLCRWTTPTHYDWGEDKYWKIRGDVVDPTLKDMKAIFSGMFQYIWHSSGDPVIEWQVNNQKMKGAAKKVVGSD